MPENGVHRGADLVRHTGEEFRFGLGSGERLVARFGQLLLGAFSLADVAHGSEQDRIAVGIGGGAADEFAFDPAPVGRSDTRFGPHDPLRMHEGIARDLSLMRHIVRVNQRECRYFR